MKLKVQPIGKMDFTEIAEFLIETRQSASDWFYGSDLERVVRSIEQNFGDTSAEVITAEADTDLVGLVVVHYEQPKLAEINPWFLGGLPLVSPSIENSDLKVDLVRLALFDEKLLKHDCFTIGWYCSIPKTGRFINPTNFTTQIGYQSLNPLAIAIVVFPEKYQEDYMQEYLKVYRLKEDLSDEWIELSFEIDGQNGSLIDNEIQNNYPQLYKNLEMEDLTEKNLQELLESVYEKKI